MLICIFANIVMLAFFCLDYRLCSDISDRNISGSKPIRRRKRYENE